jgi:hypothetical protein
MFRLPPDPGNPDAQAKGLAPQRASAAPSRGAGSFSGPISAGRATATKDRKGSKAILVARGPSVGFIH